MHNTKQQITMVGCRGASNCGNSNVRNSMLIACLAQPLYSQSFGINLFSSENL